MRRVVVKIWCVVVVVRCATMKEQFMAVGLQCVGGGCVTDNLFHFFMVFVNSALLLRSAPV